MKTNAIVSALVAASLLFTGPVFAQRDGDRPGPRQGQRAQPAPRGAHAPGQPGLRQPGPRGVQQPPPAAYPSPRARGYQQPGPRGYQQPMPRGYQRPLPPPGYQYPGAGGFAPDYRYHRGDRLPLEYRSYNYVVNDWHSHRLAPPPYGYHWVQVGADYILVAIATGIILDLLLNH